MEKSPNQISGSEQKIKEYVDRIRAGESKESIFEGLPNSFKTAIEQKNSQLENEKSSAEQLADVRKKLGIAENNSQVQIEQGPPIKYTEVVIDTEYMEKNLMPNGGLKMKGGQANWNGEIELVRYVLDPNLSEEHRAIAQDRIEKFNKGQEKTYQHEFQHIKNRENDLAPHVAATNLREFLAFRVLDEMSAFSVGVLYNQELTPENILNALKKAKQDIENSYYGEPFENDAKWYVSKYKDPEYFSRQINTEMYHKIMRQYFIIKGVNILSVMQSSQMMPEFTKIVDELILKLDDIMQNIKF
jgi:hypothetical protein